MQIDRRPGFDPDLLSKDFKSCHNQFENMCDQDEKMEDDHEWCTDSLAVELSSVESAAMAGVMNMLREPCNKGYVTAGNSRNDLTNMLSFPAVDSSQLCSRGATIGDSAYDSDERSITSCCSVSSSMLPNGRMRNRAASGATAPPSSPNASENVRDHTTTQFATPAVNRFKPTPAARSYTGNTTISKNSSSSNYNNSHTSMHFRSHSEGRFRHLFDSPSGLFSASPALSISIPTDRSSGYGAPRNQTHSQFREHDLFGVREQETHSRNDTHMQTSPHPQHLTSGKHTAENYRVEEQDEHDDHGSIASDQSLAVEVESVDEEGTYLSYGGDCGDYEPMAEYHSDPGTADPTQQQQPRRSHQHNQHSRQYQQHSLLQQHQQPYQPPCEYTVEDPETPPSYTYGQSASASASASPTNASTPQGRHFGFTQEDSLPNETEWTELPPSPQHLRRPQYRKSFQSEDHHHFHAESPSSLQQQYQHQYQGDSEASERSDARGDSASPSSIYSRELHEHQRLHGEGYRYRATTPNNLHNNTTTDGSVHSSDARGGRSINAATYFNNNTNSYPQTEHSTGHTTTTHFSRPIDKTHSSSALPRRRKRTLKVAHVQAPVSHPPPTTHTVHHTNSIYTNKHTSESSPAGTVDQAGAGNRKRGRGGDSSADEQSPHHPSGKRSNTDYTFNFNRMEGRGIHIKQGSEDSQWSNFSHSNSNSNSYSNGIRTNNGSSDSTVNINMHHMYLDSPNIFTNTQN